MLMTVLNVVYVLLAIGMIAMILMQRGAGAQAGSGFGAGASATVFGSRGAGNFLSKSTKWLAIAFFAISLFMAWYATKSATTAAPVDQDLGLMSQVPAAPAGSTTAVPAAPATVPAAPAAAPATVPTAPAAGQDAAPAPAAEAVPAAPNSEQPAAQSQQPPAQGG